MDQSMAGAVDLGSVAGQAVPRKAAAVADMEARNLLKMGIDISAMQNTSIIATLLFIFKDNLDDDLREQCLSYDGAIKVAQMMEDILINSYNDDLEVNVELDDEDAVEERVNDEEE